MNKIIFLFVLAPIFLFAQENEYLTAHFPFNDCDVVDVTGTKSDCVFTGDVQCGCGVVEDAAILDGVDDKITFLDFNDNQFSVIDFSVSFYMKPLSNSGVQDILSKQDECNKDHSFSIKFVGPSNSLVCEMFETPSKGTTLTAVLEQNRCWYHVVFVRNGPKSLLYIDGVLIQEQTASDRVDISNNALLSFSNSPCLIGGGLTRYNGYIDELRIYKDPLNQGEIDFLYYSPDRILTEDQLVFKGEAVDILTSNTCADDFLWSPNLFVEDDTLPNTTISPENPQTYQLAFNDGECTAIDFIHFDVVDPDTIDCTKAFLPSAFTPNGDGPQDNELFGISNAFIIEVTQFEIFDRWGEKVFSTANGFEKWDGSYRSEPLNTGMFVYRVTYICKEEEKVETGTVMLLR